MKLFFYLIFFSISLVSCSTHTISNSHANAANELKILFIGNSYTYNNDLPNQVKAMAMENNNYPSIEIKLLTPGGAKLQDHLKSSFTLDTMRDGKWDIIILQGHGLETLKNPYGFKESAFALIKIAIEADAEVFLFETWSRAEGEPEYSEEWSGRSPKNMQNRISSSYADVADETPAIVIPIGNIWQKFKNDFPNIELYSTDGSHPTLHGSYLTACVIYSSIFNKDPVKLRYLPAGINKTDAKKIRFSAGQNTIY